MSLVFGTFYTKSWDRISGKWLAETLKEREKRPHFKIWSREHLGRHSGVFTCTWGPHCKHCSISCGIFFSGLFCPPWGFIYSKLSKCLSLKQPCPPRQAGHPGVGQLVIGAGSSIFPLYFEVCIPSVSQEQVRHFGKTHHLFESTAINQDYFPGSKGWI